MRGRDELDQMLRPDEVADSPASSVEGLARGADGQGALPELRGQRCDPGERDVVEAVVDLIREDDDVVLDAEVADALEFLAREDLADGVVAYGWLVCPAGACVYPAKICLRRVENLAESQLLSTRTLLW